MNISALQSQALAQLAAQRLQNPATMTPTRSSTETLGATAAQGTGATFSTAFKNALSAVSDAQNKASGLQNDVQTGAPGASLEETMMAMQKAQIGFQAALNVRNRMVQAYSDITNMQV